MSDRVRMKFRIPETIHIPEDLYERLKKVSNSGRRWLPSWVTPEKDDIIYHAWPNANKEELAKALGVSPGTMRKRYVTLVKERGGPADHKSNDG